MRRSAPACFRKKAPARSSNGSSLSKVCLQTHHFSECSENFSLVGGVPSPRKNKSMKKSDFDAGEVQGLLASGYAKHTAACFVLLRILDGKAARAWLGRIASRITYCGDRHAVSKLNLAFTYAALEKLGCSPEELDGFSREFCEGMVTPHRQRILGDLPGGPSDPETWQWG